MNDQAAELRRLMAHLKEAGPARPAHHLIRTLAVTSGKGGVGKTNIAVNLCLALGERGVRAILVDADWGLSNTEILMGIQPTKDLRHVLRGECDIEDILLDGPMGMKLVPGGSGVTDLANLAPYERERLTNGLTRLHALADLIVFDTSPGISDVVIDLATSVDQIFVVTTAEPPALADAYAYTKVIFERREDAQVSLLVNMADNRENAESIWAGFNSVTERFLGRKVPLIGYVCRDPQLQLAVRRQIPLMVSYPESAAAEGFRRLADALLGSPRFELKTNGHAPSMPAPNVHERTSPVSVKSSPAPVKPSPVKTSPAAEKEKAAVPAEPLAKRSSPRDIGRSFLRFLGFH